MIQTYYAKNPWNGNRGYKDLGSLLIMFFIWPFGAWLYALYNANKKSSYVIFFLFSLLLCWHMSPTGYTDFYDDFIGILERFQERVFTNLDISHQIHQYFSMDDNAPKSYMKTL